MANKNFLNLHFFKSFPWLVKVGAESSNELVHDTEYPEQGSNDNNTSSSLHNFTSEEMERIIAHISTVIPRIKWARYMPNTAQFACLNK